MKNYLLFYLIVFAICIQGCKSKKDDIKAPVEPNYPKLIFKFKFDSNQVRLGNLGQPSNVGSGNAAISPVFQKMSAHYIELALTDYTALGGGAVLYKAKETSAGGSNAIDFDSSKVVGENEEFFSIALKDMTPGTYKWLRVSLAYQNYDIKYKYNYASVDYTAEGRLASFIGFKTYVRSYQIQNMSETINANKLQGYWGFESFSTIYNGQAPPGATTVPNPIAGSSPIPAGSCVVTGQFANNLTITGKETQDIVVIVSLSTNNSFEWTENNADGWYQPDIGETVVDMGIRGLIPIIQ